MMHLLIDRNRIAEVSRILRNLIERFELDNFTDPRFYPDKDADAESTARYFFFMVSIDHRTHRPGKPYRAYIDGEMLEGSELLYRLGKRALDRNPEFFTPYYLQSLTLKEFEYYFSMGSATIPDPEIRVELLRDAAQKLIKFYNGKVLNLVRESGNSVRRMLRLLKVFKAYSDPVEKKSFLLIKFLERRGIFRPVDTEHLEVPVDNHLVRVALRLGVVRVDDYTYMRIKRGIDFSTYEDTALRYMVRIAYKYIAKLVGIRPTYLDDVMWIFGKYCCTPDTPLCKCSSKPKCPRIYRGSGKSSCIFEEVCIECKFQDPIREHSFISTWYY